jgi:prolyl-tRNA synthetase
MSKTNSLSSEKKTAISPTRQEDFASWYQEVVKEGKLAEKSLTRGSMIILPQGQALWENMQQYLDKKFKETGHRNVYFPLLIPLSLMEQEAKHVEGFAKECAVVTHRRLVEKDGKLIPDGALTEPYIIRPTSEMVIGEAFSRWVHSYRDLPILINQWANVMRWEMRPRVFLRTSEFLWQEGHTVHRTSEEAMEETHKMLGVYAQFMHEVLAMPVIKGEKSESEKFPGADNTFTVEAMMQDGKALQAGTSHFLGQNFARAQNIMFTDEDEVQKHAWTTSWGVSTRMIGGLIMTHGDDNGMNLPPRIAPYQVAIIPLIHKEEDRATIIDYCEQLKRDISAKVYEGKPLEAMVIKQDIKPQLKKWQEIKQGTPIIIEVGARDIEKDQVFFLKRASMEKASLERLEFLDQLPRFCHEIQKYLYDQALTRLNQQIVLVHSKEQLLELFQNNDEDNGVIFNFAYAYLADTPETTQFLKELKLTIRCYPLGLQGLMTDQYVNECGECILSSTAGVRRAIIARSY